MRPHVAIGLAIGLAGCARVVTPPSCDVPLEAGASYRDANLRDLDLLFVIDDSSSMAEEQAALAAGIPRLVRALTTGDLDEDGEADVEPVRSIHVAVVGTDMGAGGVPLPSCTEPVFGGDGRLALGGCEGALPDFLRHDPGGEVATFERELACAVSLGTDGCGFEQPLEAALKALSPRAPTDWTVEGYLPPRFFMDTSGHGDGAHAGFLRPGARLAIVPVTDEDDCSVAAPAFFDPDGPHGGTSSELRCVEHPEALHPIERYVRGFLALRERPGHVLFAPVVGIPPDLVPGPGEAPRYDLLVGPEEGRDPRMIPRADPRWPDRLAPSCEVPGRGRAVPPVRLVQVAEGLARAGADAAVISICGEDIGPLVWAVALGFRRPSVDCVARPLRREPDGRLACTVELAPAHAGCAEIPGAAPALDATGAPRARDGRPVCELRQRVATAADVAAGVAPVGDGWWYDEHLGPFECGGPPSRVALPELPYDTEVTLRCAPATYGIEHLGAPCAVDADCAPATADPFVEPLTCLSGACRQACEDERDCLRAQLVGAACVEGACASAACSR